MTSVRCERRASRLPLAFLAPVVAFALACGLRSAWASDAGAPLVRTPLTALQQRYGPTIYGGLTSLRARGGGIVGDNNDAWGMRWTKSANLGMDILATLVAERRGLVADAAARGHLARIFDVLESMPTYHGVFPEVLKIDEKVTPEIVSGRIRYSTIDSAWATVGLSLVATSGGSEALAARARAMLAKQDYAPLVASDGFLGMGVYVDAATHEAVETIPFSYGDRNSEARPIVNALVGLGMLPVSVWNAMSYSWVREEGVTLASGWKSSAFVELAGQLLVDESSVAPGSLGKSHAAYVEATVRVAERKGHLVFGYAPACDRVKGYLEYGLERPDVVTPYAAALLATTGDSRAVANLERVLGQSAEVGTPLPDGFDPGTGGVYCNVVRTLDQSLVFLALYADALQAIARQTTWYPSAERRLRDMDRSNAPPPSPSDARPDGGRTGSGEPSEAAPARRTATAWTIPERTAANAAAVHAVRDVVIAVRRAQATPGSPTAVAEAESDLASATAVATWADAVPDFSIRQRRQDSVGTIAGFEGPIWWLELQGRAVLSLEKVEAGVAAGEAKDLAKVSVRRAESDAAERGIERFAAVFMAERRLHELTVHGETLRALAARGEAPGETAILAARIAAIDETLAEADAARVRAVARLQAATRSPVPASGVDPRLDLPDVVGAFEAGLSGMDRAGSDDVAAAEVARQKGLLRVAQSRLGYIPELRAGVVDVLTEVTAPGVPLSWSTSQVLGEATLAFTLRPGEGPVLEGRRAAIERSALGLEDARATEHETADRARARRDAALRAWSASDAEHDLELAFTEAVERFARGERRVTVVTDASKALVAMQLASEKPFADALDAQIALSALGDAAGASPPAAPAPASSASSPPEDAADEAREAVARSPLVRAAAADAARAASEADPRRWSFEASLEGGVLYPLYLNPGTPSFGLTGLSQEGSSALLPTRILETSALARVALTDLGDPREEDAARAEAALRLAEAELARKAQLAAVASARTDLAYARAAARAAEREAAFAAKVLGAMRPMAEQGLFDDDAQLREADARAGVAAAQSASAAGVLREAEIRLNRLLGRPGSTAFVATEAAATLGAGPAATLYRSQGLFGFEADLRERIAELELRHAEARLASRRAPPNPVSVTVQATQGLEARSFSFGLGLGWTIDPPRDEPLVLEAATEAGEARGKLRAVRTALEEERRLERGQIAEAIRIRDVEALYRDKLALVLTREREEEGAKADLHASVKLRTDAALEQALFDAERRLLAADERLARAELRGLDLGIEPPAVPRETPRETATADGKELDLDGTVAALVEGTPGVLVADATAAAVRAEDLRTAVVGGLRVAGPTFGLFNGVERTPGSTVETGSALSGDVGAGVDFAPDQAFSFAETRPEERVAEMGRRSARLRARLAALTDVGHAFGAREALVLAKARLDDARRRAEQLAEPRFRAGHVGASALAEAHAALAKAEGDVVRAESVLEQARASFARCGVALSDRALDAFARFASGQGQEGLERALDSLETTDLAKDPALEGARARRDSAWGELVRKALEVVSPVHALVEWEPFGQRNVIIRSNGSQGAWTRGALWDVSVAIPVRPKAIFRAVESGFRVHLRLEQMNAVELALETRHAEDRAAIHGTFTAWQAARERQRTARLAFDELDRRYREGRTGASVETRSQAQDDVFEAERIELERRASFFEVAASIDARTKLARDSM